MPSITANLSLIKFVAKAVSTQKIDLNIIFDAIIKGISLDVDETHLKDIIKNDLAIIISTSDTSLIKVLNESLIYYMSIWPGWQRYQEYQDGAFPYKDWYEKFRMYLMYKSTYIMKNIKDLTTSNATLTDTSTQTEKEEDNNDIKKKVAPFTLFVGGPPTLLNNIVFIESRGDVLIKQHAGQLLKKLTLEEFLNWPYFSVTLTLPDISFTRTVAHSYERFIGLTGNAMVFPEINHIVHITKIQPDVELQPYSWNYIHCYKSQFEKVLDKTDNIPLGRAAELRLIFSQFTKDVHEINVYNRTMSTNACVGFHLGNSRYIRNKKMVSNSGDDKVKRSINFYEIVNPQIDLSLTYFNAKQDLRSGIDKPIITFESLNNLLVKFAVDEKSEDIKKWQSTIAEECILYSCTLCKENFTGSEAYEKVEKHFQTMHRREQPMLCYKCGKQFDIQDLAGTRWVHGCKSTK